MQKKEGLSSVQRKMLDEIYTEQFDSIVSPILRARQEGFAKLKIEVEKKESKSGPLVHVLAKINTAYKAAKEVEEYMEKNGLRFTDRIHDASLEVSMYGDVRHPALQKHLEETRELEVSLAKKKKEIRARVYGMDTTYAEVESEIAKELATIK